MKRQLINEQWNQLSRGIMPADCCADQRKDMRRAFYAGAAAVLFIVTDNMSMGTEATEEDLHITESIDWELKEFAKSVLAGRA